MNDVFEKRYKEYYKFGIRLMRVYPTNPEVRSFVNFVTNHFNDFEYRKANVISLLSQLKTTKSLYILTSINNAIDGLKKNTLYSNGTFFNIENDLLSLNVRTTELIHGLAIDNMSDIPFLSNLVETSFQIEKLGKFT